MADNGSLREGEKKEAHVVHGKDNWQTIGDNLPNKSPESGAARRQRRRETGSKQHIE